jgi:hypothetical protein
MTRVIDYKVDTVHHLIFAYAGIAEHVHQEQGAFHLGFVDPRLSIENRGSELGALEFQQEHGDGRVLRCDLRLALDGLILDIFENMLVHIKRQEFSIVRIRDEV